MCCRAVLHFDLIFLFQDISFLPVSTGLVFFVFFSFRCHGTSFFCTYASSADRTHI
jgi:hypothetical protein